MVTSAPRDGETLCPCCGCVIAADDESPICSPCSRSYRDAWASGYRPQHDAQLRQRLLEVLQAHRGERVNVYRLLGMWPCGLAEWMTVKARIRVLRRRGHSILGYHDGTYVYLGSVNGSGSGLETGAD